MAKRAWIFGIFLLFIALTPTSSIADNREYYGVWEIQFDVGPFALTGYQFRIGDTEYDQLEQLDVPWKTHRPLWETDLNSNAGSEYMDYVMLPPEFTDEYDLVEVNGGANALQYWLDLQTPRVMDFLIFYTRRQNGAWYHYIDLKIDANFDADYTSANVTIKINDYRGYWRSYTATGKILKVCDF